MRITIW